MNQLPKCPRCGYTHDTEETFENLDFDAVDGALNEVTCPSCGHEWDCYCENVLMFFEQEKD